MKHRLKPTACARVAKMRSTRMPHNIVLALLCALLALALLVPQRIGAAPQLAQSSSWRTTPLTLPEGAKAQENWPSSFSQSCIDNSVPNRIIFPENEGTVVYDWITGKRAVLNSRKVMRCGPNGLLYHADDATSIVTRFSIADPAGRRVQFMPTHVAQDGSNLVYSFKYWGRDQSNLIQISTDGGLTWQARGQEFAGKIGSLYVSPVDARAIYIMLRQPVTQSTYDLAFYFSPDAGKTWSKRGTERVDASFYGSAYLVPLEGSTVPVDHLLLTRSYGAGSNGFSTYNLSTDGGRTFREIGRNSRNGSAQIVHSAAGLLRGTRPELADFILELSTNGGHTWQKLPAPDLVQQRPDGPPIGTPQLRVVPNAPSNLLLGDYSGSGDLWHSADSGRSWHKLGRNFERIAFTPYVPLTVLAIENNKVYAANPPNADRGVTAPAAPIYANGDSYFNPTLHNRSWLFRSHWLEKGELAQYGYPKTEPFREVNPSDGKVYLVQYFERNRFEYHPELQGTPYEILLGLLGNQLTASRRAAGEGPFKRVADPRIAGQTYFPETGHTLRNSFKRYWEARGGLAQYGYPISEEFYERNPDDGKTYVVQYFERNRFEWHPEFQGTRYEVLLGLLGNTLLREKGWK